MGDIADWIVEQGIEDYILNGGEVQTRGTTCRYCKRGWFYWARHEGRWRLHTQTGKLHVCSKYRPAEEGSDG